ncbi:MAG: hypothetical protein QOE90_1760 [Thermoplasmata archaeon]|jgi:mRNA-degrading endonuclease RelE of RelBE toxin-antitoxin system|nr:hypothetical protein [Thermoplasmata archaeon]
MRWTVAWSRRAEKDMLALDVAIARRVLGKIADAAQDPPASFVRLQGADEWKLRIGDYRALAYLSFEDRRVTVARVLRRSAAHKR